MPSATGSGEMVKSSPTLFLAGFFQLAQAEHPQGHGKPHHGAASGCPSPFLGWPTSSRSTAASPMV